MTITIDQSTTTEWIEDPAGAVAYPRQVAIDFGRPGLRYDLDVRDLIHWTASDLDSGSDGEIGNHRTAVTLRAIAEAFYPPTHDIADNIIDELQDNGSTVDFSYAEPDFVQFDPRLLDLRDGLVSVPYLLGQVLWEDYQYPARTKNALQTIDLRFPDGAHDRFGIRGIRIHALALIGWLTDRMNRDALASEGVETWIDELEVAHRRSVAAHERYTRERLPWLYSPSGERKPSPTVSAAASGYLSPGE